MVKKIFSTYASLVDEYMYRLGSTDFRLSREFESLSNDELVEKMKECESFINNQ